MKALFAQLARDIAAEVIKRADADGNVPRSATFDIQQAAGELVRRLFLGRNGRGELAPFDTVGNGAVIPLSPFMRQLWESIRAAARIPVEQNAAILANKLPADVLTAMRLATRNPFVAAKQMVSEQVFRPNPLAAYEPPHTWVDPNGYRLSDRIWNVAALERRRLDLYLDTAIREGRGALTMSRELEAFLIPGRSLPATNAPYGTTASFDAMRLARTEITRAHGQAAQASAAMNPFVSGMKWNLSGRHPKIDICDQYARGGPNGDGVYPLGEVPIYPPHPMCLCTLTNSLVGDPDAMIEQLRADVQAAKQEFVNLAGPLEVERFTQLLLGQGLEVEYQGVTGRTITPPVVVKPPVVIPPTTIRPAIPPPPVDLAAEARRKVLEANAPYEARFAEIGRELVATEAQIQDLTRSLARLEESLQKRADTPGAAQIRARLDARRAERGPLLDRRRVLRTEHNRLMDEQESTLRRVVYVADPARVSMNAPGQDAATLRNWQRGTDEFNSLVSETVAPARRVDFVDIAGRAGYDPGTKVLHVQTGDDPRITVHELGHWLEDHNPEVHRKAVEFYERRTAGETLTHMGPGHRPDEMTRIDRFTSPYMGKEYTRNGDRYATEIVSMGIDRFYNQTAILARDDPDMFDFIFNLVRGN